MICFYFYFLSNKKRILKIEILFFSRIKDKVCVEIFDDYSVKIKKMEMYKE